MDNFADCDGYFHVRPTKNDDAKEYRQRENGRETVGSVAEPKNDALRYAGIYGVYFQVLAVRTGTLLDGIQHLLNRTATFD